MKKQGRISVGLWLLAATVAMVIAGRAVVAQFAPPGPSATPNFGGTSLVTPTRPPAISPVLP